MNRPDWSLHLGPEVTRDFARSSRREWLETNGLGGWSASSISGAHTRRYHGLLVAATDPPVGRMVLLSRLEEAVLAAGVRHELACNRFPGVIHPRGFEYLESFDRGLFPEFTFRAGEVRLRKTVAAIHGHNTVVVAYDVDAAPSPFVLELRPFVAGRDYHHLMRCNESIRQDARFDGGRLRLPTYDGVPEVWLQVPPEARFEAAPEWYYDFEYDREQFRGLDYREDLFTHGVLRVSLQQGGRALVVATIEEASVDGEQLLRAETARRQELLPAAAGADRLRVHLCLAADQFLVRRGADLRTIIAGYHWFTDWGRDTMISLPGITLATGRPDEARRILRAFAGVVSEGMLPNRFPDAGGDPDYNTVDATLWFFVAVHHYAQATGDTQLVSGELLPVLEEILHWHVRGTRYGIRADDDGLLRAGAEGHQLTWMDAKVGDWVVTPRRGKPVEIQALWYNALRIFQDLRQRCGKPATPEVDGRARGALAAFRERFWDDERGCLHDVVDVDGVPGTVDAAVRPNQVFALSLPYPLLEADAARRLLRVVEDELLTSRGLRSLSLRDPAYRGHYGGDPVSRDGGYHQGTVWGWLIGPYLTAVARFDDADAAGRLRAVLAGFAEHLSEGCVGSVSEIFDGDAPHEPRGAVAQAWSVAELLRVIHERESGT